MPEDNFLNQNADAQEIVITSTDVDAVNAAATTNELVTTDDGGSNDMARNDAGDQVDVRENLPAADEVNAAPVDVPENVAAVNEADSEPVKAVPPVDETPAAHDDFDWSVDKRNVIAYNKDERSKYDKVYDETFRSVADNEMVTGLVVGLTKTDAVINIGFKSDGLISLNEFRDAPIKVGDEVEVMVVEKEDRLGNLHLSRKQARTTRAWERIVDSHKTGEIVTGTITSKTKGGLIVDVFGMETFLPGSQIDVKPVTDYDQFVGKTMEFKVVKVNEMIKNAVVSHKALIESDIEAQRAEIMSKLEKGQVLEGTIKNITDFGAFMDLAAWMVCCTSPIFHGAASATQPRC